MPLKFPPLICNLFLSSEFLTDKSDLRHFTVFFLVNDGLRHFMFPVAVHSVTKKVDQNILIKVCGRREVEQAVDKSWLDSSSCHQPTSSCWASFNLFFFWQMPHAWFIIIHKCNQDRKHENNWHLRGVLGVLQPQNISCITNQLLIKVVVLS